MFNKPFKVKSNSQLKGSERKKLRSDIQKNFLQLTEDDINNFIPNREVLVSMKIYTHTGDTVMVYCMQKLPIVFEIESIMLPTVYMLWHFPSLIHTFTTWPQVFPKITGGADLMLPGVVLKNGAHINAFGKLQKGDRVAVNLTSNKAPFAVGKAALSSFDMYMSAKRGKGVQILHFVGDHLWSWGTKLTIPDLGPPEEFLDSAPSIDEDASNNDNNTNVPAPDEIHVINDGMSSTIQESCDTNLPVPTDVPIEINLDTIAVSLTQQSLDDGQEDGDQEEPDPQEDMDNLISYCFMKAWKTTAKNIELPLLTSNFFKLHMIPACPVGQSIDLKKSSFKKLSKFLSELEQKDLIKVKELTKGVVSIVSVNREHKLFREFRLNEPAPDPKQMIEMKGGKSVKPEITEMYVVTAAVFPVLAEYLVKKGDNLPLTSIRKYVTEYVRVRKLQDNQNRRLVKLDATLQSCLQVPQEVTTLSWEELTTKFISQMTHSYQVTFSGENKVVAKGKLEPIDIQIGKRSGNKKVTLINNLELYGVNLQEFGRECQHGVAASTSISSVPGRKTPQLLVQGNQVDFVGKLLMGKYEIPKRYIRGLENAPKNKKGVQKQNIKEEITKSSFETIQGVFETAASRLRTKNDPSIYISSRTDKGVHALQSSVHLDLESSTRLEYSPEFLTSLFNKYFNKYNLDIRIQSCQTVPDTFHARYSAKSRTYLYRFAVRKPCAETFKHNVNSLSQIPFSEWKRCYFVQKPEFDETLLRSALKLFLGVRDFRTFTTIRSKLESQAPPTVRTLHKLELSRGEPLLDAHYDPTNAQYNYWNITCKARSFLYKQIRRTVGVLLAVAQGRVSVDKVQHMFECPSHESWDPRANSAPPHGLYLVNVEYDPRDLMPCDNAGELLTNTDAKIDHSPTQT